MNIFIAVYPNEKTGLPEYFKDVEEKYLTFHPSYDFSTEEGLAKLNAVKPLQLPPVKTGNGWADALENDMYTLSLCDVLVYDSDSKPGNHFLAWAKMLNVPVVCISENLTTVEPYYSACVRFACKPKDIFNQLMLVEKTVPEKVEVIAGNNWMQLKKKFGWYTYASHRNNAGVAILAYKGSTKEILVRKEHCPCHVENDGELYPTAITGAIENGLKPKQTAMHEMLEEAGIKIKSEDEFKFLGKVFPSKFMDYSQCLYAVDIEGYEMKEPEGDGTRGEAGAYVELAKLKDVLMDLPDNTIGNSVTRLKLKYGIDLLEENDG